MNDRILEVSTTVDAALSQEDMDHLTEAERLALIVGAAYGNALAERDQARAQVEELHAELKSLAHATSEVLGHVPGLGPGEQTWAQDADLVEALRERLEDAYKALESVQAPETPEGGNHAAHQ